MAAAKKIKHVFKTVTTAGTRVQVASSKTLAKNLILSTPANTGVIYFGDVTVAAAQQGITVPPSSQIKLSDLLGDKPIDLNLLYVDAATSGDKLSIAYFEDYEA